MHAMAAEPGLGPTRLGEALAGVLGVPCEMTLRHIRASMHVVPDQDSLAEIDAG